jgi:YaiO family outer membrane protein
VKTGTTKALAAAALVLLATIAAVRVAAQAAPAQSATTQSQESTATPAAPTVSVTSPKLLTNYVESGGDYLALTNGYGSWSGGYLRAVYEEKTNVWNGEINGQREFGDAGVYFALGDTHTFSENWYGALTVGSSAGGFFWPRFRTDAFMNRKLLPKRQLIATLGYGFYDAKDVHRNHYAYAGSTYYFTKPWVVEEGLYLGISNPGAVFAPSGFVAVTEGTDKHHYVTIRTGFGEEGYQLVGPTVTLTKFESQELTGTWRKWIGKDWGFNWVGDFYHNPYYSRGGATVGLFKDF